MNHHNLLRARVVTLLALFGLTSIPAFAQLSVEQVQRDFQIRYNLVTGGFVPWPSCSSGQSPAPQFPKDDFYGDLTQDPDKGVDVVNDLVQKFYSSAIIYTA